MAALMLAVEFITTVASTRPALLGTSWFCFPEYLVGPQGPGTELTPLSTEHILWEVRENILETKPFTPAWFLRE